MRHRRIAVCLVAVLCAGCRCGSGLRHLSSTLVADPSALDFPSQPLTLTATKTFNLTNIGSVPVNVLSIAVQGDTRSAFTATLTPNDLPAGSHMTATVTYLPTAVGSDSATVVVSTDSGDVNVTLTGTGINVCANVTCPASGQGAVAGCAGSCVAMGDAGVCQYPTGACVDPVGCLTGTCDGMGHCTGACYADTPACCTTPPAPVCSDANTLTVPPPPGHCNGDGTCRYLNPTFVHCDCGCAIQANGVAGCNFTWKPVAGAPAGSYASVWATPTNDLWVSVIDGNSNQVNPQSVYQRTGGNWQKVGSGGSTVAQGQAPNCSGVGCGMFLTGDSTNNVVYGSTVCTDSMCTDGGVWRDSAGTVTADWFNHAAACGGQILPNVPLTPVSVIAGAPYALNSEPCGTFLMKGNAGTWSVAHNFFLQCQANGALWGAGASDIFVSWGCNQANPGNIWHWDGTTAPTMAFTFPAVGEFASSMWGTSVNDIWAVGTHRWHCTSNCGAAGATWTQDTAVPPAADQVVWGTGTDYFVGGGYPNIYHWSTGSPTWVQECVTGTGTGPDPSVYSIWGDGQSNVYAATSIGLMQRQ